MRLCCFEYLASGQPDSEVSGIVLRIGVGRVDLIADPGGRRPKIRIADLFFTELSQTGSSVHEYQCDAVRYAELRRVRSRWCCFLRCRFPEAVWRCHCHGDRFQSLQPGSRRAHRPWQAWMRVLCVSGPIGFEVRSRPACCKRPYVPRLVRSLAEPDFREPGSGVVPGTLLLCGNSSWCAVALC